MSQRLLRGRGRRGGKKKITLKKVNKKVNLILRGIEVKRTLITIGGALTITNGSVDWLTGVDLNTGSDDRIGEMITAKNLRLRYRLHLVAASTHDFELVRIMIVKQMQSLNTKPTAALILENVSNDSFLNQSTGKRFKILYDRSHVLNRFAGVVGAPVDSSTRIFTKTIKLRNMKVKYNTIAVNVATGAGGEVNQLFLVMITDAGANPAIIDFASDFQYTDV